MSILPANLTRAQTLAALGRRSFRDFVWTHWDAVPGAGKLVWNWHLDFLCDELQVVFERVRAGLPKLYDLVINVVFGSSKSTICSILFQPWTWTTMPECRHITATHTQGLVNDFSYKSRAVMSSPLYRRLYPQVVLGRDSGEVYSNTAGGERRGCTIGGKTPTGLHAHVVGVDDPIDPQGARSQAELDTAAKFMTQVVPSRVVDKLTAPLILVMQRLEYRDPTAVLLKVARQEGAVPVRHICLPGELSDKLSPPLEWLRERYGPHVYGEDGLFDPKRLPRVVLDRFRATLGAYGYSGQVMQEPYPPGGAMFKEQWFNQRVPAAPYQARRVLYVDRAATQDGGCYTAMVLMAHAPDGNWYVEHVVRGQWEPDERNQRILAEALRCRARYGPRHTPQIVVEDEGGSSGKDANKGLARTLAGFRVQFDRPTGSKDTRAEPWACQLAAGNVYLVEDGTWSVEEYVQEHVLFRPEAGKRLGAVKDQVDSSSGAFNLLVGSGQRQLLKTVTIGERRGGPRIVVCSHAALAVTLVEVPAVLIEFADPAPSGDDNSGSPQVAFEEVMHSDVSPSAVLPVRGLPAETNGSVAVGQAGPPPHGLSHLLGRLRLEFLDRDPAAMQEGWEDDSDKDHLFTREHGKRLWAWLLRQNNPPPKAYVFASPGGKRATSVAYAVCDALGQPRVSCWRADEPDDNKCVGKGPNEYLFEQVKACRHLVV